MKNPNTTNIDLSYKVDETHEKHILKAATIRQKAEGVLKTRKKITGTTIIQEHDMLKLIHELEVHQIELEMQNEELIRAKENAENAETKYTEIYDFAPVGYLSLTPKGEIFELNLMAAEMLGKKRIRLKNGMFGFFLTQDTRSVFSCFFHNVFESNVKQSCEASIATVGNCPIYVNISGIVNQNSEQCYLTMTDITENKLAAIELTKAKEQAEESDRLKSAFLANMSHEIRTPMNGILGFASLLAEQNLSEEKQKKYIAIIEKSGHQMLSIINDIIDISKVESGLMKLNLTTSNINAQIDHVYSFFKPEVESKGMQLYLRNSLLPNETIIHTDSDKITAILINLVKNAIKFTHNGYIEIGVSTSSTTGVVSGPVELQFYVKDSGIRIPKDKQELIFKRFVQADISDSKLFNGAGLGLAISKAYVEMLDGKIWVESEVENLSTKTAGGTTFFLTIPYNTAIMG